VDNSQIAITNAWMQVYTFRGLRFRTTDPSGALPLINCANVSVDSNDSSDVLAETYNSDKFISRIMLGTFSLDGMMLLGDRNPANAVAISGINAAFSFRTQLAYPNVIAELYVSSASDPNVSLRQVCVTSAAVPAKVAANYGSDTNDSPPRPPATPITGPTTESLASYAYLRPTHSRRTLEGRSRLGACSWAQSHGGGPEPQLL